MSLREYQRKRRFDRTSEPEATGKAAKSRAIFVVQLHHARARHYDFRLQVGDTLKSWAVPKGPSFDPSIKRMAVEVEDHPVEYAQFEGEIPKGEYGGGHVAIFDEGIWSTPFDVDAQLRKGHLRFRLHGKKLHGEWHLIRTAKKARQPQWLLVKEDDEFAQKDLQADDLIDAKPVVAKKRRSSWATHAMKLSKAGKSKRPSMPLRVQLAKTASAVPNTGDWLLELKWDGYRVIAELIHVEAFVKDGSIDTRYYDKPCILVPGKKAEKGYVLLRDTLKSTDMVGVARVVIRTREYLAAVQPQGDALILMLLRYPQELVDPEDYKLPAGKRSTYRITDKELEMRNNS